MKKLFQRRKGFTLIELLIVIVIIGILAVGFAPTLLNAPKKARDGVRKGQIASIQQAVEAYALDHNSAYPGGDKVCIPDMTDDKNPPVKNAIASYFQGSVLPKDPSNNLSDCSGGYGFYYKNDATKDASFYAIWSKLEVVGSGNNGSPVTTPLAYATPLTGTGDYFVVLQKY